MAAAAAGPETGPPPRSGENLCEQAAAAAERENGLPPGILVAIGRVESGRWDPLAGRVTPWPWTLNAAGKGQHLETRSAAIDATRTVLDAGTRSIDIGCFQVSLPHHPGAFVSLAEGFDPMANAAYAAKFLTELKNRSGSWESAIEAYHSGDRARGQEYGRRVFAAWPPVAGSVPLPAVLAGAPPGPTAPPDGGRVMNGVRVWVPMAMETMARATGVLDAHAMPVPRVMTGRAVRPDAP